MSGRRALIAVLCAVGAQGASPARAQSQGEGYYFYLGNYPDDRNTGFHEDVQGVAHDADHWFITQTATLWKIPVSRNLNSVSGSDPGVLRRTLSNYPALAAYNHFGDLDHYVFRGTGYLLVPIENTNGGASPGVAIFRGGDLAYLGHATFPGQASSPWCCVDPFGQVYSSAGQPTSIRRYSLDWDNFADSGGVSLLFLDALPIFREDGGVLQLRHMQGGEFSPGGALLYLVSGYFEDTDKNAEGIHVFDVATWRRIQHSTNGHGHFNYEFHPGGLSDQEPEGLTIWDLDDGRAPGISGQLHVFLLENDDFSADQVFFKHYTSTIYVDRAYAGPEKGSRAQPFNTVAEAYNFAWNGAQISIKGGLYLESLTLSKRIVVRAHDGAAVIGD